MAQNKIRARVTHRIHTAAQWATTYPDHVLLKGEIAIESDTGRIKFGLDATTEYKDLPYANSPTLLKTVDPIDNTNNEYELGQFWFNQSNDKLFFLQAGNGTSTSTWATIATVADLAGLSFGDMLEAEFATQPDDANSAPSGAAKWVDKAKQARDVLGTGKLGTTSGSTATTDRQPDHIFEDNSNTVKAATKATNDGDGNLISTTYIKTVKAGAANGVAQLDAGQKVPLAQLPSTLLVYKGVWHADTNSPVLEANDTSKKGWVYTVGTAGTEFGIVWKLGDWAIYNDNGDIEQSHNSDDVVSVNEQQGVVSLDTDDIPEGAIEDRRYVTTAQKALIDNLDTPGGPDGTPLNFMNLFNDSGDTLVLNANPD